MSKQGTEAKRCFCFHTQQAHTPDTRTHAGVCATKHTLICKHPHTLIQSPCRAKSGKKRVFLIFPVGWAGSQVDLIFRPVSGTAGGVKRKNTTEKLYWHNIL